MDAINIVKRYTDVGVYNVPTRYIIESLEKLLTTTEKINPKNNITNESKKSLEFDDNV